MMKIKPQLEQLERLPCLLLVVTSLIIIPRLASAQASSAAFPSEAPLEVELLEPNASPPPPGIITANTISQEHIATPSLWWAQEQFDPVGGKLLANWIAYEDEKRIDLVVKRQPWTLLDDWERYTFVNHFGTVARDYQYNVRVFNDRQVLLATYTCDYTSVLPACQLKIPGFLGLNRQRVNSQ